MSAPIVVACGGGSSTPATPHCSGTLDGCACDSEVTSDTTPATTACNPDAFPGTFCCAEARWPASAAPDADVRRGVDEGRAVLVRVTPELERLPEMVIRRTFMTMSNRGHHWSVAAAKAELSRLVESAQRHPQVIERRGKAVAVVVAVEQFEDGTAGARWQKFLEASAEVRAGGGGELRVPHRERRRSPFARA